MAVSGVRPTLIYIALGCCFVRATLGGLRVLFGPNLNTFTTSLNPSRANLHPTYQHVGPIRGKQTTHNGHLHQDETIVQNACFALKKN